MPSVIETTAPTYVVEVTGSVTEIVETTTPEFVIDTSDTVREVVETLIPGPRGPQGVPGPVAEAEAEIVSMSFAYGDAAHAYYTAPAACRVVGASLTFRVSFNGNAPTVVVGTNLADDSILSAGDSDPQVAGTYAASSDVALASGAGVWLTITPDGAARGAGVLTLYISFD